MPLFDTWQWKIAIVLALVGAREFVRLFSPKEVAGATGQTEDTTKWLMELFDSAAIAIGLVLFVIQPFLIQAFYIPSGSMLNTLQIKDRLLVSKLVYRLREPRFQEVVVFRAPPEALRTSLLEENSGTETDFIKRCIGTPGDVVYAQNRQYFHNGQRIEEPYAFWSPPNDDPLRRALYAYDMKIVDGKVYSREYESLHSKPGKWQFQNVYVTEAEERRIERAKWSASKVPPGMFLMLGDHRNNSNDSHVWGFVPRENIVGKAVCVFWPPPRLGLMDRMSFHPRTAASSPVATLQSPVPQY